MTLVKDLAEEIIKLHLECMLSVKSSLEKAIEIGHKLHEQKKAMDHGTFTPWIEETLPFTVRTAQNYLKLFIKKDELLAANVDNVTEAYLLLAPKEEKESDVHIHKNPTHTEEEEGSQATQYAYWDHLEKLNNQMLKVYERLAGLRDSTTPKALGFLIGNIKEMADVLQSWDPNGFDTDDTNCESCGGDGCDMCINGKTGIFQESDF